MVNEQRHMTNHIAPRGNLLISPGNPQLCPQDEAPPPHVSSAPTQFPDSLPHNCCPAPSGHQGGAFPQALDTWSCALKNQASYSFKIHRSASCCLLASDIMPRRCI